MTATREHVLSSFDAFRIHMDENNDRRERLVKISRDITIQSKRVIFLLHRLLVSGNQLDSPSPEKVREIELSAASEAYTKLEEIKTLFEAVANEIEGQELGRFEQAISPGLQEFIEGLSFAHYLRHNTLITYAEVQAFNPRVPLSHADYLLGLSDLTGELMRFAISAISVRGGGRQKASDVCHFVRNCSADFEALTPYVRGLSKKQQVTNESLKKIEQATYAIAIRGSEYADMVDFQPMWPEEPRRGRLDEDDGDDY